MNAALDFTPEENKLMLEIAQASRDDNPVTGNDPEQALCKCETIAGMQKMANGNGVSESFRLHLEKCENCKCAFKHIQDPHTTH